MEFQGKIIAVLPIAEGQSKSGNNWKKQEYVIENHDQYPKKMCFNLWSDKIDQFNIQLGEELNVFFDIDCREWNGKWFNDIRAWKVERVAQGTQPQQAAPSSNFPPMNEAPAPIPPAASEDDLPF